QWLHEPENRQLVELLGDMCGSEVFLFGGKDWIGFTDLALQLAGAVQFGPRLMIAMGQNPGADQGRLRARLVLQTLAENAKVLKVPETILGFKLSNTDRARAQLKRLEQFVRAVEEKSPRWKGRFKREKVGGADFLTLRLDGGMVPWEDIPFKHF